MSNLILLKDVPNLDSDDWEPNSIDLTCDYWYPTEGEKRRVIYWEIAQRRCMDQQTGEEIDLDCAIFIQPQPGGEHKSIANGSKRLVAVFENNAIERGTPIQVTYLGKRKNRTNQNMSDHWSVVTLAKKKGK